MALTRDFKETIRARVERDPKFRRELLREGIASMLDGDIATAKTSLRDYINATVGFAELAHATQIPSKSLMRMLGPGGNPRADNLFEVVSFLQQRRQIRRAVASSATPALTVACFLDLLALSEASSTTPRIRSASATAACKSDLVIGTQTLRRRSLRKDHSIAAEQLLFGRKR